MAGMLVIRVTDCGPGIDPQLLPALFDLFTTGQGRGIGSGIGLFFCKLAVEAQSGRIWAENVAGGGAVLSFTLPIAR
jgi:signal transduction histidine kinase